MNASQSRLDQLLRAITSNILSDIKPSSDPYSKIVPRRTRFAAPISRLGARRMNRRLELGYLQIPNVLH